MGLGTKTWTIAALGAGLALAGCATAPPGGARAKIETPAACEDLTVHIYFEPESAEVTDEGRAVLSQAAASAKTCKVERVKVLGLADAVGAPAANLELSKQRVASVTKALIANGLPAGEFDLAAAGQQGAVTQDGEARPLRRRADVTLELTAP